MAAKNNKIHISLDILGFLKISFSHSPCGCFFDEQKFTELILIFAIKMVNQKNNEGA
jgi:hypothetical protein